MRKSVTVAIPLYNEEAVMAELVTRLKSVFSDIEKTGMTISTLFINDGSADKTLSLIKQTHRQDSRFGYITLSRNFGHQAAISAALDHIHTDAIIVMDADLQDRPERFSGKAKYTFTDLYKLATDGIASFSVAPLRVAQFLSMIWTLIALSLVVWLVASRPLNQIDPLFGLIVLISISVAMLFLCM